MKRKQKASDKRREQPSVAPGLDDVNVLGREATKKEVRRGDSTEVTRLALDEADPSE